MLTVLCCTFEGPQKLKFEKHITLYLEEKSVVDMMLNPNKLKDDMWEALTSKSIRNAVSLFQGRWEISEAGFSSPLTCGCLRPPWTEETWLPSTPPLPLHLHCCLQLDTQPHKTSGPGTSFCLEGEKHVSMSGLTQCAFNVRRKRKSLIFYL